MTKRTSAAEDAFTTECATIRAQAAELNNRIARMLSSADTHWGDVEVAKDASKALADLLAIVGGYK